MSDQSTFSLLVAIRYFGWGPVGKVRLILEKLPQATRRPPSPVIWRRHGTGRAIVRWDFVLMLFVHTGSWSSGRMSADLTKGEDP